jgi:hypothetical protein
MMHDQVFGIYFKDKDKPEKVKWLHDLGMDQIISDHKEIAEAAADCKMDVLYSAFWDEPAYQEWSNIERQLQEASQWRRLDSIIMNDEPMYFDVKDGEVSRGPETFKKITRRIRCEGWSQSLSISFLGPSTGWSVSQRCYFGEYLTSLDKVRINLFPFLHSVPLGSIHTWVNDAFRQMSPNLRPLTVTLQTWRYKELLPPIEQLAVMSYLVLLSGAGLSFFDFNPDAWGPHFTAEFEKMMRGGLSKAPIGLVELREELKGKEVSHYLDRYGIFHATVRPGPKSEATYYSINTTGKPYEDGEELQAYQIIRSDAPLRPYPPPDPYPWDEQWG